MGIYETGSCQICGPPNRIHSSEITPEFRGCAAFVNRDLVIPAKNYHRRTSGLFPFQSAPIAIQLNVRIKKGAICDDVLAAAIGPGIRITTRQLDGAPGDRIMKFLNTSHILAPVFIDPVL